jgi:uncharacterized protein YbaP (TraB family)
MASRSRWSSDAPARLLHLALGLLLAGAAAAATPDERHSTPTLWRALDAEGREAFFLIGSVHVGRAGMLAFAPAVEQAYARADELVLELATDDLEGGGALRAALRYGLIPPPETLHDRLSARAVQELARYLERRGESLAPYLQVAPWAIALQIVVREATRAGLDPRHGVDRHFAGRAAGSKPVVGLETAESQLEILANLPRKTQEELLLDTLEHVGDVRSGTEALVDAWARGDDAAVERVFYRPMHDAPELAIYFEQLIFGRNERMTQRLASLARDGKLRFVVVGAGHMVGERGIPALLRDYGFILSEVHP